MASSVVGGRLQTFLDAWKDIRAPSSVLRIIEGYRIPFIRPPPLSLPVPSSFTVLTKQEHIDLIDAEVEALLAKGAVEEAPLSSPGYVSKLFLVPKPIGWRPIINLKRLNKRFIDCPHFRMDTVKDVSNMLLPGDWAASIDLKDAYFHVPIHRKSRRYLRFGWRNRIYQFRVLPFGLCLAPLIFTRITKTLKNVLHTRGIRSIWYLDDILIVGRTKEECAANVEVALQLLRRVGFIVNLAKSTLTPAVEFRFLGLQWNTVKGEISIDDDKLRNLRSRASAAMASRLSCRDLQVLLGHLASVIPAVPLIRLHSRFLQRDFRAIYRSESDARLPVVLSEESRRDLEWIASLSPLQCRAPMWTLQLEDCQLEVSTDVSDVGWGIYAQGSLHRGRWSTVVDAPVHINAKELMTLRIYLQDFLPHSVLPRNLAWRMDSSTALAYIRREGGTASLPLLLLAKEILLLAHRKHLRILPIFVPSEENLLADRASRFEALPDWRLPPSLFHRIVNRWGLPVIDLFATEASAQVDRFYAWGRARRAEAFDALAQEWDFPLAYAFPPPPLLPRVLRKIAVSVGVFLLVTPFWPAQKWYPSILGLRVEEVRRLPEVPPVMDLISGSPPLPRLPLLVWKISGGSTDSLSPTTPSASSVTVGETRQRRDMTLCGAPSAPFSTPAEFLSFPSI